MESMLDDLAPNGAEATTMTCRVPGCENSAPKMGRYAGKCLDHRTTADASAPKKRRKPVATVPPMARVLELAAQESPLFKAAVDVYEAEVALAAAKQRLRDLLSEEVTA